VRLERIAQRAPTEQPGHVKSVVSRWGEHGDRPEPLGRNDALFEAFETSASVDVACDSSAAWQLVTDVSRIGEFSPECIAARWIDGASGPLVGARFEGTNRVIIDEANDAEYVWIRPCTVTAAQQPERFGYTVGDRYDGTPSTRWDIHIESTPTGCRITEQFRHLPQGLSGSRHQADAEPERAEAIIGERIRGLNEGITTTLRRMKLVLEQHRAQAR
jgi:hypothetical protein